ncbi:hypothetical protein [Robertmurraya korlensis]|uniref:hypothetical protein n=1 Tax=Robertmurraya korlensis TaxID=519977 RepID=UPI00082648C5|nr:hypothetical protein [Robertmurraya korlensis]
MYRRNRGGFPPLLFIIFLLIGGYFLIRYGLFSPSRQAVDVVEAFYEYEQTGDYAESWELLHPSMKERFPKGVYIQDRVHVFMGHFGADTFEYKIGDVEKQSNWKMSKESKGIEMVYEVPVTQYYQGKYGTFDFIQYVYVTEEKGDWVILWDYNY